VPFIPRPFATLWIAEVVRLHEARLGMLDDTDLKARIDMAPADAEERILLRAEQLGQAHGWDLDIVGWRRQGRTMLLVLAALAALSGFFAAVGIMGDGSTPVNVGWVLGGLLGVHIFSLALWLIAQLPSDQGGSALLGRLLLWVNDRLPGSFARKEAGVGEALLSLLDRHGMLRWFAGAISHLLWFMALLGALGGLIAMLATQNYTFAWETTILPGEFFVALTAALGALPAHWGFSLPDTDMVRAAINGQDEGEAVRLAWSSWLVGGLIAYGILPRLLLFAACMLVVFWRMLHLRLDLTLPYFALLRSRLMAGADRIGVIAQAPRALPHAVIVPHASSGGQARRLVGVELGERSDWPASLPEGMLLGPIVESREERRQLLQLLMKQPAARLLVALDAMLSPDRGTLAFVAELADSSDRAAVWLHSAARADAARLAHWRETLAALGLPERAILQDRTAALGWLERDDD